MDDFRSLSSGEPYSSVVALVASGTEMSRVVSDGDATVAYSWTNPDGSNMNVIFQNNRLVSKAQAGLK